MKIGTVLEAMVMLHVVEIEGRGGDSVRNEYFAGAEDAIFASAIHGQNRTPSMVTAMKFSDGTLMIEYRAVSISPRPPESEIAKLTEKLTPAQKILLGKSKKS